MNGLKYFLIFLTIAYSLNIFSQDKHIYTQIMGMIVDLETKPIAYTTVLLYPEKDTIKYKYAAITNDRGIFIIDSVKMGSYYIKVTSIGFKKYLKKIKIETRKKQTIIDLIELETDIVQLGQITKEGQRKGLYTDINKTVLVPDSTTIANSKNGLELVGKMPEIKINKKEHSIKIVGESNTLVLINGMNSNRLIETIRPDEIEKVELITNPSSKFNSDISSIVNIVLKDKLQEGFSVYTELGFCPNIRNNEILFSFNYRIKSIQTYINYSGNLSSSYYLDSINSRYGNNTNKYTSIPNKTYKNIYNIHRCQFGADINLNKKRYLSYNGQILNYSGRNEDGKTSIYSNNGQNEFILKEDFTENRNFIQLNNNLYYNQNINEKTKLKFTLNLYNLIDKDSTYTENLINYVTNNENNSFNKFTKIYNVQNSLKSNIDFSKKFSNKYFLEFGIESYIRNINIDSYDINNKDFLKYFDNRNSIYASIVTKKEKINYQLGIRLEEFNVKIMDTISNNYWNIIPNFSVLYKSKKMSSLSLSLNKNQNYPSYSYLNPYQRFSGDSIINSSGNPFLIPEKSYNLNLNYRKKINKFNIGLSYDYIYTNDIIVYKIDNNINNIEKKYQNIGKSVINSLNSNIIYYPNKNLTITLYGSIGYSKYIDNNLNNGYLYYSGFDIEVILPYDLEFYADIYFEEKGNNYNGYYTYSPYISEIEISKDFGINWNFAIIYIEPFIKNIEKEVIQANDFYQISNIYYKKNSYLMFNLTYNISKGKRIDKKNRKIEFEENPINTNK